MTGRAKTGGGATTIEPGLQAQVDAQLLEQGAFSALELLLETGRLAYSDYERWRQRETEFLDTLLMGSAQKIQAQIRQAADYARGIGLVEQTQEFHAWPATTADNEGGSPHSSANGARPRGDRSSAGTQAPGTLVTASDRPLRLSADPQLHLLIAGRYVPAQDAPQMDLFFDNPVVALTNGIVRALSARDLVGSQRQLDRLYAHAPNHADLGSFDRLVAALGHLHRPVDDPAHEVDFLLGIAPTARRLLGSQSRDLLAPLWRQLADALAARAFSPELPNLHRSFALSQAQDWTGVAESVLNEPSWSLHATLCMRLAQSGFHRRRRIESLTAWCHLCWRSPEMAADILDGNKQPDAEIAGLWQAFRDSDEACSADDSSSEPALTAADFPAWLLVHETALTQHLPFDLPTNDTTGEENYHHAHRWAQARRGNRHAEEMELRKALQGSHPALFRYLKQSVSAAR